LQLGYAWISAGKPDQVGTVFAAVIQQALAAQDPRPEGWGLTGQGDVLVAQGDGPGALAAYRAGLAIAEGLAKRDPANSQRHVDLAISCAKLADLGSQLKNQQREGYLCRGIAVLSNRKQSDWLYANQDWIGWFEEALQQLPRMAERSQDRQHTLNASID
jgi:hypothetical protein